jgi:thiol-disulfide isomerase/thioredoxin
MTACHSKPKVNYISIKGDMRTMAKEVNGRKLYLTDVHNRCIVDSTVITNGEFSFKDTALSDDFQPYLAAIKFWDTAKDFSYLRPLGFQNPYLSKQDEWRFYVDRGETEFHLDSPKHFTPDYYGHPIKVMLISKGSVQNEPFLKSLQLKYGHQNLRYSDSIIRAFPFSIYLLDQLYSNKQYFSVNDLQFLLKGFSGDLKNSNTHKKFENYFAYLARPDNKNPQLLLPDEMGQKNLVIETGATCQLLVFWASWCGPCRKEIPDLKTIYAKYKAKGLAITSISIDANKNDWATALAQEQMPWKQFVVDESAEPEVDIKYNIVEVPSFFLIDKNQKLIKIKDAQSFNILDSILDKHLQQSAVN